MKFLGGVAAVLAVVVSSAVTTNIAAAQIKIALLYVPISAYVASYVAKDQGYFDRHGLSIELTAAPTGGAALPPLIANAAQISVTTPPQLLQADEQGLDLMIVAGGAVFPVASHSTGLIARTNSGIKEPADLIGKKVAIPGFGSILDIMVKAWFEKNGVDSRKVDFVELQFPQLVDALKSGLVDAEVTTNPFMTNALDANVGYALVDANDVIPKGALSVAYVATRAWVGKNPSAVPALQQSLADAIEYIADAANLDSVRATIAKYTHLPPQVVAALPLPAGLEAVATPDQLTFWIDASARQGWISKKPDAASIIAH